LRERVIAMEKRYRRFAVAGSLVVAVFIGYAIGPSIATAVGNLVKIEGRKGHHVAKVSSTGRLAVDTEAGVIGPAGNGFLKTFAQTTPSGEVALVSSSGPQEKKNQGIITGVVVDVAPSATGPVTVILRQGLRTIWRGSLDNGGGHISDTFENGIYSANGFRVVVANPTSADVRYVVYGEGFGVSPIPGAKPSFGR
jgi:hypothetical protein